MDALGGMLVAQRKRTATPNRRGLLVILWAAVVAVGSAVLGYRQVDPFAQAGEEGEAWAVPAARVPSVGVHVH